MPIYEYICPHCGSKTELRREIDARDRPIECEQDGSLLRRKVSAPAAIQFKGAGFHCNDYGR